MTFNGLYNILFDENLNRSTGVALEGPPHNVFYGDLSDGIVLLPSHSFFDGFGEDGYVFFPVELILDLEEQNHGPPYDGKDHVESTDGDKGCECGLESYVHR